MTRIPLRAGALSWALLATAAPIAPVAAQTAEPAHRAVDANGVDLISGTFPFSFAEGTIGSGEGALSIARHGTDPGGTGNWQNMYAHKQVSGATTTVILILGDRSESFTSTGGGAFVPRQGNGATLTGGDHADFIYTSADGTTITFGAPFEDRNGASNLCGHANADQNGCFALATGIARPNAATMTFGWDVHPNCATVFNPDGGLDCIYSWRLDTVANSFGYAADFSYVSNSVNLHQNPSGNWFKRNGAVLSNGATTRSVSYDFISSTVTEITDADGRLWRLTSGTNALGIRRPGSSSDDISVSFTGGIVTQVVRDGVTTGYARSVAGSNATTLITDALSQVTTVVADTSLARITSVTDPLNRQTQYQYDTSGRPTRVTRPEGDFAAYSYDGRGNLTEVRQVAKPATGVADVVASATYAAACDDPACNRPLTTTDARGNVTDYAYDPTHGGLLSVTVPAPSGSGPRPQTRYAYTLTNGEYLLTGVSACAAGSAPSCVDTADETRVVIGYDANGNATSIEQRSGNSSGAGAVTATNTMTYDGVGNLLTVDGPLTGTTDTFRYRYNSARQVIGVIGPDSDGGSALHHRAIRTSYGADGQPTKVERGTVNSQSDGDWANFATLEEAQIEYDSHHRPAIQRLVSGSTTHALTQTSYDGLGRPECSAHRMNSSEFATAALPADACTLDSEGSFGPDRIARTSYDAAGQVTLVQTGYGVTGVVADEVAATYSANGQVAMVTDANSNRTTYEYDGFDRLLNTRFPSPATPGTSAPTSGTGADYEQLGYDAAGNVTSRRLRDGNSIAFSYDALNRLTLADNPLSASSVMDTDVSYVYDLLGRLTQATDNNGHFAAFAYDALGRTLSEESLNGGTKTMQYDAASRRTRLTWPDNFYVDYVYDATGAMTAIRENGATSGAGVLATFAYDDLGRRTSLTRGNGRVTVYGYDAVSRLAHLGHHIGTFEPFSYFSYNPAGQISSLTRTSDAMAFTAFGNVNVASTVNGLNQITQQGSIGITHDARGNVSAIGSASYGYNLRNQLTAQGAPPQLYHEPLGRLTQQWNGGGTLDWVGSALIGESGGSNPRRYVHGPGIDEPLVWYENGARRYLHADERGSIVAVTDDSGALLAINRYDEYGVPQGGALIGRFGYTGQAWLPEFGMYYYRARIYNPSFGGRFMQADPIGYGGGMNLYAYVSNDPMNVVDPSGLLPPPDDEEEITVTGRRPRRICPASLIQIGNVCVSGADLSSIIFTRNSFTFTTFSPPDIGPGVDCTANGNVVTCERPENRRQCPSTYTQYSFGVGATLALFLGVQAGTHVGISVPDDDYLTGTQFFLSGQGSGTLGVGGFIGAGLTGGIGHTNGPMPTASSGPFLYYEADAGYGPAVGVSGQGSPTGSSTSFGLPVPRLGAGYGLYGGVGAGYGGTLATRPFGCDP